MAERLVTFHGASDDCIEIDGCPGADEFYANGGDFGLFDLISAEGTLRVKVTDAPHGCWSVALMPIELLQPDNGYTVALAVHAPADAHLRRVDQGANDG